VRLFVELPKTCILPYNFTMTINIKKRLRLTLLFSLTFLMITAFSQTKSAGEIIA
jgi:hypothetical protein